MMLGESVDETHRNNWQRERRRETENEEKVLEQLGGGDKYDVELEAGTFYQHVHWWRLAV